MIDISVFIAIGLGNICLILLIGIFLFDRDYKRLKSLYKNEIDEFYERSKNFRQENDNLKLRINSLQKEISRLEYKNSDLKQVVFDICERIRSSDFENNG